MELTATTFVSLDGVMQAPGGPDEDPSDGFVHGGWAFPYFDEEAGNQITEWFSRADCFLLGRTTYDIFAAHWPHVTDDDDPVATRLNTLPKYVASRTMQQADWKNTTIVRDPVETVRELKVKQGREIQVHGSGDLLQTLLYHNLVDEHRLMFFPVVLGGGRRLFREGLTPYKSVLSGLEQRDTGIVMATYRAAGDVEVGTFAMD